MSRLFFFLLVFLFDLYVFQAFKTIAVAFPPAMVSLIYGIYWSIPLILVLGIAYLTANPRKSININLFSMVRAILLIAYLSKFLIMGVLGAAGTLP